jgi:hypothetical protein
VNDGPRYYYSIAQIILDYCFHPIGWYGMREGRTYASITIIVIYHSLPITA